MDQDRLDEIVGLHKSWLTKKRGGEAADFFKQDLRGLDLHGANLRFADFRHANLAGVDLGEASLEEASFGDANLMGMRKRKTVKSPVDESSEVWHVVPNPRRR